MARTDPQINFRMPQRLRDALDSAMGVSGRSLTAEIVERLEGSFRSEVTEDWLRRAYLRELEQNEWLKQRLLAADPEYAEQYRNLMTKVDEQWDAYRASVDVHLQNTGDQTFSAAGATAKKPASPRRKPSAR